MYRHYLSSTVDVDGGRRGVKTDARVGDEPPLPPPYDPPEDPEDIIEILDPVGGADYYDEDFEVPPVVDFTKDEFGSISHASAATLIDHAIGGRSTVSAPGDPSNIIGVVNIPYGEGAESVTWSATCRCKGHKACSRMRTSGAQEPSGFSGTVLVRWLVKGLELKDVSGKSLAHQHMHETRRENPGKGK